MQEYRFLVPSFRAKARNLFRWRSRRNGRASENGKHGTPYALGSRCFIWALKSPKAVWLFILFALADGGSDFPSPARKRASRQSVYEIQSHIDAASKERSHAGFASTANPRETLIKSQNQISYGFLYIASSTSSLNSSLFASNVS